MSGGSGMVAVHWTTEGSVLAPQVEPSVSSLVIGSTVGGGVRS